MRMNKIWLSKHGTLCKNISFNRRLLVYTQLLGAIWNGAIHFLYPYRDECVVPHCATTNPLLDKEFRPV